MEDIIAQIWATLHKTQVELDEKTNQFNTVENFVEKFIPIRIQSQISETLASFLTRSQMNKLENFEMEKFNELNLRILDDDGSANLQEIMKEIMKEILKDQEVQKKKGLFLGGGGGGTVGNASAGEKSVASNNNQSSVRTKQESGADGGGRHGSKSIGDQKSLAEKTARSISELSGS